MGCGGKVLQIADFLRHFSIFPQEFSTHRHKKKKVRHKEWQKVSETSQGVLYCAVLLHFSPPFFHTQNGNKIVANAPHITKNEPFHSFRRLYYYYY